MTTSAQSKAVLKHRASLKRRGLGRFEVQGRVADKELLRKLARKLAEEGGEAVKVREVVTRAVGNDHTYRGGIWAALRRSPLVGAELDLGHLSAEPREIDL